MKLAIKQRFKKLVSPGKLKELMKTVKPAKKIKPVKKNTWKRKLKAWNLHLDRRQQQRTTVGIEADRTQRVCSNCGESYTGRLCPQCGQPGTWSRYTWKQAALNFLDIWGLGNRPMFRTLKELFWRPGYMIRDYLNGHRQFYFPPFKLLAVTVILYIFVTFLMVKILGLMGGDAATLSGYNSDSFSSLMVELLEGHQFSGVLKVMADSLLWFFGILSKNLLYDWLFLAVFLVICVSIAFRFVSRYNIVETYIFFIFILSQMMIYRTFKVLGSGLNTMVQMSAMTMNVAHPPMLLGILVSLFFLVASVVSAVFMLYGIYLFVLNFKQFYGLSWKSTVSHLVYSLMVGGWLVIILLFSILLFIPKMTEYHQPSALLLIAMIIVPIAFVYVNNYIKKNEPQVNRTVIRITKTSMLSVLFTFFIGLAMIKDNYNIPSTVAVVLLYFALTVGLSLMPIALYKKYHRTWVAFLPLLLTVALVVGQFHFY